MNRSDFAFGLAATGAAGATIAARPRPAPTPTLPPDPVAEKMLARAKEWWRVRKDVPYLEYGALIRYKHNGHVFDDWWQATFRSSDGALHLERIAIPEDEEKRLRGIQITIFGARVFDTNPDAEPIRVQEPFIEPNSNFGILTRYSSRVTVTSEPTPNPLLEPVPSASPLREIGKVEVSARDYDVRFVGEESLRYGEAYHLKLTPLRDARFNRLRDLWVDKQTYATTQLSLDGLYNGKPYDGVRWIVRYVPLRGQWYVQQLRGDNLRFGFGFEVKIEAMEIDLVDYHFPSTVPKERFEKLLSSATMRRASAERLTWAGR